MLKHPIYLSARKERSDAHDMNKQFAESVMSAPHETEWTRTKNAKNTAESPAINTENHHNRPAVCISPCASGYRCHRIVHGITSRPHQSRQRHEFHQVMRGRYRRVTGSSTQRYTKADSDATRRHVMYACRASRRRVRWEGGVCHAVG